MFSFYTCNCYSLLLVLPIGYYFSLLFYPRKDEKRKGKSKPAEITMLQFCFRLKILDWQSLKEKGIWKQSALLSADIQTHILMWPKTFGTIKPNIQRSLHSPCICWSHLDPHQATISSEEATCALDLQEMTSPQTQGYGLLQLHSLKWLSVDEVQLMSPVQGTFYEVFAGRRKLRKNLYLCL